MRHPNPCDTRCFLGTAVPLPEYCLQVSNLAGKDDNFGTNAVERGRGRGEAKNDTIGDGVRLHSRAPFKGGGGGHCRRRHGRDAKGLKQHP